MDRRAGDWMAAWIYPYHRNYADWLVRPLLRRSRKLKAIAGIKNSGELLETSDTEFSTIV